MGISYFTLIVAVGDPIHDLNCVGCYPNPVPPNLQRDPHIFPIYDLILLFTSGNALSNIVDFLKGLKYCDFNLIF